MCGVMRSTKIEDAGKPARAVTSSLLTIRREQINDPDTEEVRS